MNTFKYSDLIDGDSKYPAVIAVAKLARKIGDEHAGKELELSKKPVKMAIEALKREEYLITQ